LPSTVAYRGTCDASAAVRLGSLLFVSASDEDYILRTYDHRGSAMPCGTVDFAPFLKPADPDKEPDIEGAAASAMGFTGSRRTDETRTGRSRRAGSDPVGRPYTRLIRDLISSRELREFELERASTLAPEERGGLNLEGLAPTPEGHLLLRFRNPVPDGLALVVAMRNPAEVIDRVAQPALSITGRLDLGGRGIRAIEFVPESETYLIIAGARSRSSLFSMHSYSRMRSPGRSRKIWNGNGLKLILGTPEIRQRAIGSSMPRRSR
jgi:hypothetical protein